MDDRCPECGKPFTSSKRVCNVHGAFCSDPCIEAATDRGRPLRKPHVGGLPERWDGCVEAWLRLEGKEPWEVEWAAVPVGYLEFLFPKSDV